MKNMKKLFFLAGVKVEMDPKEADDDHKGGKMIKAGSKNARNSYPSK